MPKGTDTAAGGNTAIPGGSAVHPTDQQAVTVAQEKLPTRCDGKEQYAFEAWAAAQRYDMNEHPLHYLFLNERTAAARDGWAAGLKYASDIAARLASVSSASAEGFDAWLLHYVGLQDAATMRFSVAELRIAFEAGAASPEPVPATNQAGEVWTKNAAGVKDGADCYRTINGRRWEWWGEDSDVFKAAGVRHRTAPDGQGTFVHPDDEAKAHAALATQPATSKVDEAAWAARLDWDGNAQHAQDAYEALAATPTPPTLSEDLQEALSDMLEAFTNSECGEVDRRLAVETARAALAQVKAS